MIILLLTIQVIKSVRTILDSSEDSKNFLKKFKILFEKIQKILKLFWNEIVTPYTSYLAASSRDDWFVDLKVDGVPLLSRS